MRLGQNGSAADDFPAKRLKRKANTASSYGTVCGLVGPSCYNKGRAPETLACDRLVACVEEAARLLVNSS